MAVSLLVKKYGVRLLAVALAVMVARRVLRRKKKTVEGKTVLVTGAASGVGRSLALALAKRGAKLVLWDVQGDQLQETRKLVEEATPSATIQTDRVNLAAPSEIYAAAERVDGYVDILINNAGIVSGNDYFTDVDMDRAELTVRVNMLAHMHMAKAFLPGMMERDTGHIVSVASVAAFSAASRMVDYSASKFGARGFAEGLCVELDERKSKVKVSCVCPTHINTALFQGFSHPLTPTLSIDEVVQGTIDAIEYETELVLLPDRLKYLLVLGKSLQETFMYELGVKLPIESPLTTHDRSQLNRVFDAMK
ncbi:Estradiol 17-beta-dehydrogenase 11 [Hondaea fermentalgiana]|uniref:Short-chain dehydrogenase/reductase 3 n=1 Tax=Hondaea fermentalgiana TaxID=2315210 RepID=A0A2R5GLX5_9STRA|nr:Estradiol 17-beta-dehydrogenase 11 [Hondaea fermentalgiana]|eukprot:GBG31902.1 Estradiol 17-beta-dehydrogenase 11 [Hondaea fermentalgiana]